MTNLLKAAIVLGVLSGSPALAQTSQPTHDKPQGLPGETKEHRDARMAWWREARFGMFIHWGLYAVPAGTTNDGRKIEGIGEWIMLRGKIPVAEYAAYAKRFNPTKYDPDAWVRMAKSAGMKYIVITSKHHDGFALFDSKATDYDVVDATPYGKDLLKPLAQACRKHGMKLGFYYSQAQDWHHPGGAAARGGHWDPAQDGSMDEYIKKIAVPQVKEILTNYGDVAVLWWDTPTDMNDERAQMLLPLVKLQPNIVLNNRLGAGIPGDTETPEQYIPATGFPGRDFEVCMTMNDTWGFKSYDDNWKSTETLLRNLIDIASKGGNYLLNVGPTAEGEIPQPSIERLQQIGAWMGKYGDPAIYGTSASPFKKYSFDGRATRKGNTLFLHVFKWPSDGIEVKGLTTPVKSVALLRGNAPLKHETTAGEHGVPTLKIARPAEVDPLATVLVVECAGEPQVDPSTFAVRAKGDGSLHLSAADALIMGRRLKLEEKEPGAKNLGSWTDRRDFVLWDVIAPQAGEYSVSLNYACDDATAGSEIELTIGDEPNPKASAKITSTGGWDKYEQRKADGTFALPKGAQTLKLKPTTMPSTAVMNLKEVTLTPTK